MSRVLPVDIDDNSSVWAATARPVAALPELVGAHTADVVILGAGFTGMSTAYHLSARYPDRKIVILEAKRVGNGASGRSGGMALNWINGVETHDAARAQRIFGVTRAGIDAIADTIARHQLDVRFRRVGCLDAYTRNDRAEHAHAHAERLSSWGIPVRYLQGPELATFTRAEGVVGAVLDPTAGQLHGLDYLHGLRGVLLQRGVEICEHSPAVSIVEGATHIVTTPRGSVTAPTLVLATNGYTARLGYFTHGIFPLHSHAIATEPLPLARWDELGFGNTAGFSDDLDRIAYASLTADGRLVFGGGGNAAYSYRYGGRTQWPADRRAPHAFVQTVLQKYFPHARDVRIAQQWTGTLGVTLSRVCSMGVTGAHKNVLYALGYSGHGVVLANLAGQVLCDLYSDNPEPWRDLPFFQRALGVIPPDPLRWVGYHAFTAVTGRSPRRA